MKKLIILLLSATLCFSFTACSNDTDTEDNTVADSNTDEQNDENSDNQTDQQAEEEPELMEIDTEYGTLSYPAEYKDSLTTNETNEDGFLTISFNADVEGQSFTLFNIMINSEEGDSVGTITSDDGTVRNVFADITELPDISGLGEDEQNQLYAMQEGLNVLIENLD